MNIAVFFKSEGKTAKKRGLAPFPANYFLKKFGLKIIITNF